MDRFDEQAAELHIGYNQVTRTAAALREASAQAGAEMRERCRKIAYDVWDNSLEGARKASQEHNNEDDKRLCAQANGALKIGLEIRALSLDPDYIPRLLRQARIDEHKKSCTECLNYKEGWGDPDCRRLAELTPAAQAENGR